MCLRAPALPGERAWERCSPRRPGPTSPARPAASHLETRVYGILRELEKAANKPAKPSAPALGGLRTRAGSRPPLPPGGPGAPAPGRGPGGGTRISPADAAVKHAAVLQAAAAVRRQGRGGGARALGTPQGGRRCTPTAVPPGHLGVRTSSCCPRGSPHQCASTHAPNCPKLCPCRPSRATRRTRRLRTCWAPRR